MNKLILSSLTLTGFFSINTLQQANAASNNQYNTDGKINYLPSANSTKPVDPTNPDPTQPITPQNPDGSNATPGTKGPLSIDFASSLDFGSQAIVATNRSYNALAQKYTTNSGTSTSGPNFVQITDNRGSFSGWKLSVKQDTQFKSAKKNISLDGANLTFNSGIHVSQNTSDEGITATNSFTLNPGEEVTLMTGSPANDSGINGTGGTHILRFGNNTSDLLVDEKNGDGSDRGVTTSAIKLNVPGKAPKVADNYTTNLNWILSDTPSNTN
ncbi:WxL domain-containing protein [Latilactobacillus fragifolii]|uniref:WxL domain-containing protein n=1 Tax=Latilactobacillus fragifolii TaxID=2814244 RepID=UPI001ABB5C7D|nr:WxL domain-containing protein [Latilactobacillus fragifolii]